MMEKVVRYVVKTTSIGTENNKNFSGQSAIYFCGKNGQLLSCTGDYYKNLFVWPCTYNKRICRHDLVEYGYRTEAQAKKSYSYRHPENSDNWRSTAEIVRVEIGEGKYEEGE